MSLVSVKTPVFDDIPSIQFFNGRQLSGEDMTTEQAWNAARRRLLGQALGSGVAFGLEVSVSIKPEHSGKPIVTVEAGLALNADGETLSLPQPTDVSLVQIDESAAPPAEFGACLPTQYGTYVKSDGVYLLAVCPASGTQGRAPVMGLANQEARCNRKYRLQGMQFRLHQIKLTEAELTDRDRLRNLVAYKCFNPEVWHAFVTDPFAVPDAKPKLLDGLLVPKLEASEVPLATIFWTTDGGIEYVDLWSVRRKVIPLAGDAGVERSYARGLERTLQFNEHVAWLLNAGGPPSGAHVTDYFRFIPPGVLLPVRAPGYTDGFRVDEFLADLYKGGPASASLGQCARLLIDSLDFEYVDLTAPSMLQLYTPTHVSGGAADTDAGRRYYLCVSRDLYGPLASDDVAKVLEDAWDVYRGLVKRQVFLPPGTDDAKIAARLTITEAVRDVMAIATRYAALALGADLDIGGGLRAYQAMYDVQNDMTTLFGGAIPGIDDTQERELFASSIDQYLNHGLPGSRPGLKAALDAGSLTGAVDAQIEINKFVGTWSGEGVAIGPFGFTYSNSPEGVGLVPGAAQIPQVFTLSNGTNRTLTMLLDATASAATGDWANSTRILGAIGGSEIDRATLASGASRDIVVMVGAPADAAVDEPVTLTLTAEVGPPTSRTSTYENSTLLKVAESSGGPVAGEVHITAHRFNPLTLDPADIASGAIFGLRVSVTYAAGDGIARDFDLDLMVAGGDATLWTFRNEDTGVALPAAPSGTGFTLRMTAVPANGSPTVGRIRVEAPARDTTTDRSVTLNLSIRSVDLTSPISGEYDQPITLVVKHGT